jgi:hypothetical protein
MLAEAIMEHNEIKIIKFPKNKFKGKHWKLNIESIEEIKDDIEDGIENKEFVYTTKDPMKHLVKLNYEYDENLDDVKPYGHINDSAKYIHDLRRQRR